MGFPLFAVIQTCGKGRPIRRQPFGRSFFLFFYLTLPHAWLPRNGQIRKQSTPAHLLRRACVVNQRLVSFVLLFVRSFLPSLEPFPRKLAAALRSDGSWRRRVRGVALAVVGRGVVVEDERGAARRGR